MCTVVANPDGPAGSGAQRLGGYWLVRMRERFKLPGPAGSEPLRLRLFNFVKQLESGSRVWNGPTSVDISGAYWMVVDRPQDGSASAEEWAANQGRMGQSSVTRPNISTRPWACSIFGGSSSLASEYLGVSIAALYPRRLKGLTRSILH